MDVFLLKKTSVVLHGALLQWCYERKDWQSYLLFLWEREINKTSSSLYILHKWCSVVFLEYVQLFACMVLKPGHSSFFWLMIYKVLPGFVFVPIVLCKLLHVFYYCLNFKTIQFWIWYHTLFLAANSGELIILVLAPGFQRSRWVKVVFNGAVEWKWSSVRGGAIWLIAGHFLTHGMLQISK